MPKANNSFVYTRSSLWNAFRRSQEGSDFVDFTISMSLLKIKIKTLVSKRQKLGDGDEWHHKINFSIEDL